MAYIAVVQTAMWKERLMNEGETRKQKKGDRIKTEESTLEEEERMEKTDELDRERMKMWTVQWKKKLF